MVTCDYCKQTDAQLEIKRINFAVDVDHGPRIGTRAIDLCDPCCETLLAKMGVALGTILAAGPGPSPDQG
jgi:hypothetical protein